MRMRVFRIVGSWVKYALVGARAARPDWRCWSVLIASGLALNPVFAQETLSYTYDARGRLVKVDHGSTGPNAGVVSTYGYDPGDNRCNVTVTMSGAGASQTCSTGGGGGIPTITLSPATLPGGTVGVVYSQTITATGGTSPYTFAVSAGVLPAGLSLSSAGLLSGTPNTANSYNFTVKATDSAANAGSLTYSVAIAPAPPCVQANFAVATNGPVVEGINSIFTVTKGGATNSTCSVNYATASGTATTADYTATSGTLTFSNAQNSLTVSVPTINDTLVENSETFKLNLSNATGGATITTPTATATITDNDGGANTCTGVSFAVNDVTVTEGTPLVFTVTKSGSTSNSCNVNYATSDSGPASGRYTPASGVLTFAATATSKTISVTTIDDADYTGTNGMHMNLSGATGGATIADSLGIGSIYDNDSICDSSAGAILMFTDGADQSSSVTSGSDATTASAPDKSPQPLPPPC